MLRHWDLLLQPTALPHESSLFFLFPPPSFVTFLAPTLPWRVCVFFFFFFLCVSSQGLTGYDAVDQIAATRGERHQHYHSWLCGARRVHQRRHHPQLSPRRWWRRRHLRALGGGAGGVGEHSRHRRRWFGLRSHSFLFGIYFKRGAARLLSLYLGL